MPPSPYRAVTNRFAYTGPVPRCDCDLLETRFPCQQEDLVHTELLDRRQVDQPLDQGRRHASYVLETRRCPVCAQAWWMHVTTRTDVTYARDDEARAVGSVTTAFSDAVRCRDLDTAGALGKWIARYTEAEDKRDRLARQYADTAALRQAVQACIDLAGICAETRIFATDLARRVKPSEFTVREEFASLQAVIAALETDPADLEAVAKLQRSQARCRAARKVDPAATGADWGEVEVWTPALAPMRDLQYRIWGVRNKAQGKVAGSPEHRALREIEDAIAKSWTAHHAAVDWPGRDVEFHFLLEHARSLQPGVVAGDTAAWGHPFQVCKRLRELVEREGVAPSWRVTVPDWIAQRTGLPDGAKRTHEDACRRAYLDKWRRERARLGPGTPPPKD